MGIRETIQNRATNQSASWAIIAAILAPLITAFTSSNFTAAIPIENLVFSFAMTAMLLLYNRDDKKQEHNNAAATLTNPKTTERLSDNMGNIALAMKTMEVQSIQNEVDAYLNLKAKELASKESKPTTQTLTYDNLASAVNTTEASGFSALKEQMISLE